MQVIVETNLKELLFAIDKIALSIPKIKQSNFLVKISAMANGIEIMGIGVNQFVNAKCNRIADIYLPARLLLRPKLFKDKEQLEIVFENDKLTINQTYQVTNTKIVVTEINIISDYTFSINDPFFELEKLLKNVKQTEIKDFDQLSIFDFIESPSKYKSKPKQLSLLQNNISEHELFTSKNFKTLIYQNLVYLFEKILKHNDFFKLTNHETINLKQTLLAVKLHQFNNPHKHVVLALTSDFGSNQIMLYLQISDDLKIGYKIKNEPKGYYFYTSNFENSEYNKRKLTTIFKNYTRWESMFQSFLIREIRTMEIFA